MSTDDAMWQPSLTGDNAEDNPKVIANLLKALTRETRDGFESIGRALVALTRIEERLDVVIDRQNHQDLRLDALELRIVALETKQPLPVARTRKKRKSS